MKTAQEIARFWGETTAETKVSDMLQSGVQKRSVRYRTHGAADLLRYLLDLDHVHFIVGHAVNPAHQNPDLPKRLKIRPGVVREIAEVLRERGKEVSIEMI